MSRVKLYEFPVSPPVNAVKMMLGHKGIEFKSVRLLPGYHALMLRAAGFRAGTVPALKLDGRRVSGSTVISRLLDEIVPDPPLFPADPGLRARVEAAERWGDQVLQEIPRTLFRWSLNNHRESLVWLIRTQASWMPLPRVAAWMNRPVPAYWARRSGADDAGARAKLAELPAALDEVERLIAEGVIGGDQPNAADFQIAASVRVCLAADSMRDLVEGRPSAEFARRLMPTYPDEPIPLLSPR